MATSLETLEDEQQQGLSVTCTRFLTFVEGDVTNANWSHGNKEKLHQNSSNAKQTTRSFTHLSLILRLST